MKTKSTTSSYSLRSSLGRMFKLGGGGNTEGKSNGSQASSGNTSPTNLKPSPPPSTNGSTLSQLT